MTDSPSSPPRRTRLRALACALYVACLLIPPAAGADEEEPAVPTAHSRLFVNADWPEGITYQFRKVTPSLRDAGPLSYFADVYLLGRIGARLDIDAAAFAVDESLRDFHNDVRVRRARFYLLGDFRLGLPLGYKFEISVEGRNFFLNDFYFRWKPSRWVDSVDFGYLTPPMGLENVVSSRSLTFMEVAAPVQALAPGFHSGIAAAGHSDPWRIAWKFGFFSAGQEQISGDASEASAQFIGRLAGLPWRQSSAADSPLVHLGLSARYVLTGDSSIHYRARPESFIAPFVVDTDDTAADNAVQTALEAALSRGPLLVSGEFLSSSVDAAGGDMHHFYGLYGLASWMVTGEYHPYDTRTGLFSRLEPRRPFSFSARQWGAVEIGQRASWLDLTNGDVRGGKLLTLTTGFTWYLNTELKFFANYGFAHVTDRPERGDVNVFQMRIEVGI